MHLNAYIMICKHSDKAFNLLLLTDLFVYSYCLFQCTLGFKLVYTEIYIYS